MDRSHIHFELFLRRHMREPRMLTVPGDDRGAVMEAVEAARDASAIRVPMETRERSTGDFRPVERKTRPPCRPWRRPRLATMPTIARPERPSCTRPEALYAPHARDIIGRVLEAWLARNAVTPFELLHRPDLAERLEAGEAELSMAIHNAAATEASSRGASFEPIHSALDALVRQAIERLARAGVDSEEHPSLAVGMAIAARMSTTAEDVHVWRAKIETLLDLIARADDAGPASELARRRLQQPLAEALGGNGDLEDILGVGSLGEQVLTLVQIAAPPAICVAACSEESIRQALPPLTDFSARLAADLHASALLTRTRRAIAARALRSLASEERLWPNAPEAEVRGARAAFALLRASGRLIDPADLDTAETARWRVLTSPEFVEQRLSLSKGALEDADILLDLIGAAHGREAITSLGRRLVDVLGGETFMAETRLGPDTAALRFATLAGLQRRIAGSALDAEAKAEAGFLLTRIADQIDADGIGLGRGPILITHPGG